MVSYNDVAKLQVGQLTSPEDALVEVSPKTPVAKATEAIEANNQTMALVRVLGKPISVTLRALNDAIAKMADMPAGNTIDVEQLLSEANPVRVVEADTAITALTGEGVPSETFLVVDPKTREPESMITRAELASRVRGLSR